MRFSGCQAPSGMITVLAHLIPTTALGVALAHLSEEPERLSQVSEFSLQAAAGI